MELWYVLSLMTAVLWGFAVIFAKLSTPKLGVTRVVALMATVEPVMYGMGFLLWRNSVVVDLSYGVLATISATLGTAAYLCFFESVMQGQVAIIGTISAAYPSLTIVGALAFLSESPTAVQLVGVTAIVFGIAALSYGRNSHSQYSVPKRSLFFALLAFLLWGLWSLTNKIAVSKIGTGNVFGFYVISTTTVPLAYLLYQRIKHGPFGTMKDGSSWIFWFFGAAGLAVNVCGTFAFTSALSMGLASLVVPTSSAYPLVAVAVALLLLHEKLNRFQLASLACVIVGLFMVSIGS
jgi:transporter family protein